MVKSAHQLFQEQQKRMQKLQTEKPELFINEHIFNEDEVLPKIGITALSVDRPDGYIRLYPQDFIVEETDQKGNISYIEPHDDILEDPNNKHSLYADLIKIGMPTIEVVRRMAESLKIPINKIGFAGIKDAQALTSQRISISGISYDKIKNKKFDGFFLTNLFQDKGSIQKGQLAGNRFTIFIRTKDEVEQNYLKEKLTDLKNNGFLNYYQTQRFGGIRLMSHIFGKLILQGKYEKTIEIFLTEPSYYDILLIKNTRLIAKQYYGDWRKMKEIFFEFPHTFQNELRVLDYLIKNNDNFIGALINIQEQTTLWVYAYASLLFNRYLSENPDAHQEIPLLLSNNKDDRQIYQKWLDEHEIDNIEKNLAPFKFIKLLNRPTPTKVFPEDTMFMSTSAGAIISFFLPKGAYATAFLMNLFKLKEGNPVPGWVKTNKCDTKKYLKIGTSEPAEKILKDYIESILDNKTTN